MIRNISILALLLAGVIYLSSGLIKNGIYYMPLKEMQRTEEAPEASESSDLKTHGGWGEAILKGNLFDPYRAEPPRMPDGSPVSSLAPIEMAPPPEEKPVPQIELNGIILNQYGEHVAYIKINNATPIAVRKGDSVEGIRVINVTQKVVDMLWDNKPISMTIEKIKNIKNKTDMTR